MTLLRPLRAVLALALLAIVAPAGRAWAVTVSPTALFIDSRSPTGTLTLYNSGTRPEELEVSVAFGYPRTDSTGAVTVELVEAAPAGEPSLVPYLRVFPRRLVLQPGQRQVLRVMVQPPAGLAAGEYWGRVVVRSRGGQEPVEQTQGDVRMQIAVETAVATAVLFRKGEVTTGVAVNAATAATEGNDAVLTLDLERRGGGAYLGRVTTRLVAPNGTVAAELEDAVALYRSLRLRVRLPFPAGATRTGYRLEYTVDTERSDLPATGALKAPPVSGAVPLR